MTKRRQDNDVIDRSSLLYVVNKIEPSCRSDRVQSMTKTGQDNDMANRTSAVYCKIRIELS